MGDSRSNGVNKHVNKSTLQCKSHTHCATGPQGEQQQIPLRESGKAPPRDTPSLTAGYLQYSDAIHTAFF